MGHRANFVVIRGGEATAYHDQWAALGCVFALTDGPGPATAILDEMEQTTELLDWGFAEGGFLLDFDRETVILFGPLEDDLGELEDFEEGGAGEGVEGLDASPAAGPGETGDPYEALLSRLAPRWPGWLLCWDDRGVDAFAAYLEGRDITSIRCQPPSHPPGSRRVTLQA